MKLLHRLGYYLGGFSIGLIALAFFLNGKKVSCDYGPEARVIKNINIKPYKFSDQTLESMESLELDSLDVFSIMKQGSVKFSESDTRKKPCGEYKIEHEIRGTIFFITVENCENQATVVNLNKEK